MPFLRPRTNPQTLWREWDRKAQKNGLKRTVYSVNGDEYTGEWRDNKKHGKGTQIWKVNGARYDGDWENGKRNGFGTYSIPDPATGEYKKVYSGEWKHGKRQGFGTNFSSDEELFEGYWFNGKKSGWGRMYFTDCSVYEGEWLNDKPNGYGMLRLPNENRYEGSWKDGKKHGQGKFFYFEKGQFYSGVWNEDIAKCGTMIDFGRENALQPTSFPIPQLQMVDASAVLEEAKSMFLEVEDENV
ncbi:MORN repeat-containing protein 3 [Callorhinchus milii]|nr:MORN repeat-containing protein 3 [Callorhinchus milii]